MERTTSVEPIVTVTIRGGLADRHRLPLSIVIKFLSEFKTAITSIGRDIHVERGGVGDIDFGLEVIGVPDGNAFTKGSLSVRVAITQNHEVGALAARSVLSTLSLLNRGTALKKKPAARSGDDAARQARVIASLERLAFIHTKVKSEVAFKINQPTARTERSRDAVLGGVAIKRMRELEPKPEFIERGVSLYGKLFQLRDKSAEFTEDRTGFWGELRLENGERWRIKFGPELEAAASTMFRKQVRIEGDTHYFKHRTPRVTARKVEADGQRDYERAFEELFGIDRVSFSGVSFSELLDSRYGG